MDNTQNPFLHQPVLETLKAYISTVNATKLSQEQFWLKTRNTKKKKYFLQANDQWDPVEWIKVLNDAIKITKSTGKSDLKLH